MTSLAVFESTHPGMTVNGDGTVRSTQAGETTILVRYLDQQVTVRLAFVPERPLFTWARTRRPSTSSIRMFSPGSKSCA